MIEEWKDIKGYEGLYQVSNLGRVKRHDRILKQAYSDRGYSLVCISKNNKPKTFRVHRLVAESFIQNQENKPTVNHIDEDKTNNAVFNLEWATMREQNNHGTRTERTSTRIKAIDIATGEYNEYISQSECARKLGLKAPNINMCLKGKCRQIGGYIFEYSN